MSRGLRNPPRPYPDPDDLSVVELPTKPGVTSLPGAAEEGLPPLSLSVSICKMG